ncbi:MAG: transcription antitermination factor NusB [Sphaerochaetaceae bacterium]|nr:transcription antitermination factor NusB [Sphaerochaetaceae bacterium]NLO61140.1 transcription antitermination factor NusB [Spirochaetales bacterium]MDD2405636.1 transcription antitermination factor NusB [Sphaerochaetaceae bacterium]MDD3670431.1 transcription antitermination factor NusB [Sphaerochaetaceae bacterium]MDD4260421.1 transcription antitermination factor NusB [Sphaerochaetaceae bacterium]
MKSRHKGRELALQTLYAMDFNKELGNTVPEGFPGLSDLEVQSIEVEAVLFARYLIVGTVEHLEEIDNLISEFSTNRPLDKIDIVDRNILRFSVFCLLYANDIHGHVIIDEAVKLSQEFSSDVNYKFINGILDSMQKRIRNDKS